jgi:hypothetical protein
MLGCSSFGSADGPAAPAGADAGADADAGAGADAAPTPATPYSEMVLGDNPILYLRLGDRALGKLSDSAGSGLVGLPSSPAVLDAPGLLVNDSDNGIRVTAGGSVKVMPGTTFDFADNTPFSIECWVKPTASNKYGLIVGHSSSAGVGMNGYALYLDNDGKAYFERREAGVGVMVSSSTVLAVNVVYHLVAAYTGTSLAIYVNGKADGLSNDDTKLTAHGYALYIGQDDGELPKLEAFVDELAIYPLALPADRVTAHYKLGAGEP